MKPYIVAVAVDSNQFPPAAFLASRLAQLNPRDDVDVVIFSDSMPDLSVAQQIGVPAELQHLSFSNPLPSAEERISGAAFMRLFLPEVVPSDVVRILYLDADVYPENPGLFNLFALDLGTAAVAAVRDILAATPKELAQVGVSASQYLNSGVLLLDRQRCLDLGFRSRAVSISMADHLNDQGSINRAPVGGLAGAVAGHEHAGTGQQ